MYLSIRPYNSTLLCLALCGFSSVRQTHGQFTTIINVPPESTPRSIESNTQLNLFEGGTIRPFYNAGAIDGTSTNIELNIAGGSIGERFDAQSGSTVNISGGSVDDRFVAHSGSTVNISGGSVGDSLKALEGSVINVHSGSVGNSFDAWNGSVVNVFGAAIGGGFSALGGEVNISGGSFGDDFHVSFVSEVNAFGREYRLNGVLLEGLDIVGATRSFNLPPDAVLSGTFADGTPFAFSDSDSDRIGDGTLTLTAAEIPPIGPAVIMVPNDSAPRGIRAGQTLLVKEGGAVGDNFNAGWGSTVHVTGGELGENFEAVSAEISINGGSVGDSLDAFGGSVVNISGGSIGDDFEAHNGSIVSISGGSFGNSFSALSGSTVRIAGGTFGDLFRAHGGSMVNISGGEFRFDGVPMDGLDTVGSTIPVGLPSRSVLSGTLADGTPFALSSMDSSSIADGALTMTAAILPPVGPALINLPTDPTPLGIRSGQTMVVNDGGTIGDNFNAGRGSTVHVAGGDVGDNLEAVSAMVAIYGGSVGDSFDAFGETVVAITGGTVGQYFDAFNGSTVNISGGAIGDGFDANDGSTISISGGSVGHNFDANEGSIVDISGGAIGEEFKAGYGSEVNISGGLIANDFEAHINSEVNLFGTQFLLNNLDISSELTLNAAFTIGDRDVTLSGLLADGSPFSFDLFSIDFPDIGIDLRPRDFFHPDATLTITLILPGDYTGNGIVDAADYAVWRNNLGESIALPGDTTPGTVTQTDYIVWKTNYGATAGGSPQGTTVPEPGCLALFGSTILALLALPARTGR